MHKRFFATLLAVACVMTLTLPASAVDGSPALSGESSTEASAKIYDYQPIVFNAAGNAKFGNTLYCSAEERIYDQDGRLYRLIDSALLADSASFRTKTELLTNAAAVKSVKLAKGQQRDDNRSSFVVTLADDHLYRNVISEFQFTYTALRDSSLPVLPLGVSNPEAVSLSVKKGAKLVVKYKVNITEDALFSGNYDEFNVTPAWYGDVLLLEDPHFSAGVDGLILTPQKDLDADLTWKEGDNLVAQVNFFDGSLPSGSKLSTQWPDAAPVRKRSFGDAYVRIFRGSPATQNGNVTLTLTNPFLSFEGVEIVSHKDVVLYEQKDGTLKDITSDFRYGEDSKGNGAFVLTTDHLGSYILASQRLA